MTDIIDSLGDWNAVAEAWDAHVDAIDVFTHPATTALVDRVGVQPGDRLLELAAGPGALGTTWSRLVGPTGTVLISDSATGMVEVASRRTAGMGNVEVAAIDLAAIPRPDASFDVVVCVMGLMFTSEPSVPLAEIHRVLAPGGRLGALTWGGIEHNPWMTCVGMAAMMNGLVSGGPPIGPGTVFSLGDAGRLEALAVTAGFRDVVVEEIGVVFTAEHIEAHIDRVTSLAGPLATAIREASDDQRAAARRTAADLAAPYISDTGVEIPGRTLLVSGRR
ncbi:MAG: methyltransferase domain-containing protein [Ilumatobacteraceae bacterium]